MLIIVMIKSITIIDQNKINSPNLFLFFTQKFIFIRSNKVKFIFMSYKKKKESNQIFFILLT